MPRVHTHYDNLKVAKDAPMEVIHAAYRSLAAMYHPDRHPGDEEAARIMRVINKSYLALCDPGHKRDHDRWIASKEAEESAPPPPPAIKAHRFDLLWSVVGVVIVLILGAGIYLSPTPPSPPTATPQPSVSVKEAAPKPTPVAVTKPRYVRPSFAPNGVSWPETSRYLDGYEVAGGDGFCGLLVDASRYVSDVLVKVYAPGFKPPNAARIFFLKSHDKFEAKNLEVGEYEIHYQDLDDGSMMKSDTMTFWKNTETRADGRYEICHGAEITLYKVINPQNPIHFYAIGPEEF